MSSRHRRDERIVLGCGSCNERTILGGPEEVWLSGRTSFECGCGRVLTLAHRIGEEYIEVAAPAFGSSSSGPGPRTTSGR